MKEKLENLLQVLNKGLVGKEEVLKISLLTMLSGENIILIGPPGTAKSEVGRRMSKILKEDDYFEYLLTKFSTPEEIFGPLSIEDLKKGNYIRKIQGYLPSSRVAFLDEIFKANSSILNSLLTILNEKIFHNGNKKIKTPLAFLIGASNELPLEESQLSALYDRFLMRMYVDYVEDTDIISLLESDSENFQVPNDLKIDTCTLVSIKEEIKKVYIPREILVAIGDIRKEINNNEDELEGLKISDRRIKKIVKILKVSAYTNDRLSVDVSDMYILIHMLWNDPNDKGVLIEKINAIVGKIDIDTVEKTKYRKEISNEIWKKLEIQSDEILKIPITKKDQFEILKNNIWL
ncbi:MAG: AAA family ATPase [Fusobacterium sp.]